MNTTIAPIKTQEGDFQQSELLQQLKRSLRVIISRVYLDGVDRIFQLDISENGEIKGIFTDGRQAFEFELSGEKLSYKQVVRKDSYLDGVFASTRLDAVKKRRCKKGFSCGNSCIAKGLTCNVNARGVVSPREAIALRDMATKLRSPAVGGRITATPKDPYEDLSIRELKAEARNKLINGYSNMTSDELRESLRLASKDPDDQERIRKTLESRDKTRKKALRLLPKELARFYDKVNKASRLFTANPDLAGLLATALVIGATTYAANQVRLNYKSGLVDSAKMAYDRSKKIPVKRLWNKDIIFAVGGLNEGDEKSGQAMKEFLETPQDGTRGEAWFKKRNEIIAVDHPSKQMPDIGISKKNPDGSDNPAYLGYTLKEGFGKSLENFSQGNRSEAATDLAAQMYAYGSEFRLARINVLGHGAAETREAIEILNRIRPEKGISGKEISKRINLVNMGSPYWGLTNDKEWKDIPNRTITSRNDPFSWLPKTLPQYVNGVKGHGVENYLKNTEVRDRIREAFGFYNSSIENYERSKTWHRQNAKSFTGVLSPAGFAYNQLIDLVDLARTRPFAATIRAGSTLSGASLGVYAYAKNRYRSGIKESVGLATKQYESKYGNGSPTFTRSNVMFTVGSSTSSSEDLKNLVEDPSTGFKTAEGGQYHIVNDWGEDEYPKPPENLQPGTPEYNMWIAKEEYGRKLKGTVERLAKNILPTAKASTASSESVKLATEMFAYGKATKAKGYGEKPIPVLAHRSGGLTAREAIEIVKQMEPGGREIAARMQLVTLGSPHFGFGLPKEENIGETAISSEGDFFSPFARPENARTVKVQAKTGEAKDYFDSPAAKAEMESAFKSAYLAQKREKAAQEREQKKKIKNQIQKQEPQQPEQETPDYWEQQAIAAFAARGEILDPTNPEDRKKISREITKLKRKGKS